MNFHTATMLGTIHNVAACAMLFLLAGCSRDPLSLDAMPHAKSVISYHRAEKPVTRRIIQLDDWHFVPRDAFAADLRSQDPAVTADAIEDAYLRHLADVECVQAEQLLVLRHLAKRFEVDRIYLEGFAVEEIDDLAAMLVALDAGDADRETRLQLGAAGQMWCDDEIAHVLPAESRASLAAAKPTNGNLAAATSDQRHKTIVATIGEAPTVIVVLGAAHDLTNVIPEGVEYVRVRTMLVDEEVANMGGGRR